jgi:tRNA A37 threonylcarbamoyladenosine dehydratase
MAERLRKINPQARVDAIAKFYSAKFASEIFVPGERPDFVIDAIDSITSKCHLIHYCKSEGIPIVTSTGSGGRMDPTQVKVEDLGLTTKDPLARSVRRILREKYGFTQNERESFGVPAVFSSEEVISPKELRYDGGKGFRCVCPQGQNEFFNCDNRNLIMGNASFVTGTFGLVCASVVVRELTREPAQ